MKTVRRTLVQGTQAASSLGLLYRTVSVYMKMWVFVIVICV